ncbi:hypothetical protein WOLCODRAFT_158433 [Wolfiporia cocos MD-104 SS10]|uniref:Uncharacterized protein n=1 Tax=Wolfiporia cocos (strain MD-104) TaxID=742152 RepID=A0A2H3JGD3_WOLCO|nr:hypothetical protein WOLCODRAFT_158433 [Wolfiporia cocos MD-104 SS10]
MLIDALRARDIPCPILRLSAEILCLIFSHADDGNIRTKLTISHVCKKWRDTALAYPFLWATLDVGSAASAQSVPLVLARAQGCPLNLSYDKWETYDTGKVRQCINALEKTESLTLRLEQGSMHCRETFDVEAPFLCHLMVRLENNVRGVGPRLIIQHPRLATLSLVNFTPIWCPGQYSGLTMLRIVCEHDSHRIVPFTAIRDVLADLPHLEKLVLINCIVFGNRPRSDAKPHPQVSLPCLRIAILSMSISLLNSLLDIMELPPSLRLTIQCWPTTIVRLDDVVNCNTAAFACLQYVHTLLIQGYVCSLCGYGENGERILRMYATEPYRIDRVAQTFGVLRILAELTRPMPCLRTVRIVNLEDLTLSESIHPVFRLPNITRLELAGDVENVISWLLGHFTSGSPFFSGLETLVLEDGDLDKAVTRDIAELLGTWPSIRLLRLSNDCCFPRSIKKAAVRVLGKVVPKIEFFDKPVEVNEDDRVESSKIHLDLLRQWAD